MELKAYDPERCELCGTCLSQCPELHLTKDQAKEHVKRLHDGDLNSPVLKACVSCFACNQACPNGLNVHGLILSLWARKRPGTSLPSHVRAAMPSQAEPGVWTSLQRHFTPEEKSFYQKLEQDVSGKEVLYLGCNQILNPYIADSPLLADLTPAAAPGICCGEPLFRIGYMEAFERAAKKWLHHWKERNPSRMIVYCPAGMNMFRYVYPAYLGEQVPIELKSMVDWLSERIEAGRIDIKTPVNLKVTIQDSCHVRVMGQDLPQKARRIIRAAGAEVIEPQGLFGTSLCCGFAGVAPRYSPLNMLRLGGARLRDARRAGAQALATYCNGCLLMLSFAERLMPFNMDLFHMVELLEMASGIETEHLQRKRARQIMTTAMRLLPGKLLRPGSNYLDL